MRVYLKTLGCRLNEAELESWSRDFLARGIALSSAPEKADLLVINSCAVTEEAVRKSRKLLRRARRDNPGAKLVMSGCYASLEPEKVAAELGVDLLVPNQQKERLVEIASRELALPTMPAQAMEPGEQPLLARNRQRAFIKVQDGCRYRCSYCIVTLARGEERSRALADIVAQINQLHGEGIREVVLAGVHLGGYGSDNGSSLYQLVQAVLTDTDMPRIRLGSLEPWDLAEDFWSLFDDPRLMPHLHLPMQSGAESVLRRMSRRCRTEEFLTLASQARQLNPDFNLTTDIIVGFPGESETEWQQTLEFVEQAAFGHVHIFAFSPRSGTKAAILPDPLPQEIKRQRSEALHELAAKLKRDMLERQRRKTAEVLVEGNPEPGEAGLRWSGYTPNYLRVSFSGAPRMENRIVRVRLEGHDDERLQGFLLKSTGKESYLI